MPCSPSAGSASTRLVGTTASFIDAAASTAFSADSATMCEKPKFTLVSFAAMKLHSPCPPDMTRQGAPSGSPLFNNVTSIDGHLVAASAVLPATSRHSPGRKESLISPPVDQLAVPAIKVAQTGAE